MIKKEFPKIKLNIIPVISWRSPLFDKKDREQMKENKTKLSTFIKEFNLQFEEQLKLFKKNSKELKEFKKEITKKKKEFNKEHSELIILNNIKEQTFLKLPSDIKSQIENFSSGKYDLTDAYFLAKFLK